MGSFSLEVNDSKKEVLGWVQSPRADGCTDFSLALQWCSGVTLGLFPLWPKAAAEVPVPPQAALWLGFRHCAWCPNLNSVSLALLVNTTFFSLNQSSQLLLFGKLIVLVVLVWLSSRLSSKKHMKNLTLSIKESLNSSSFFQVDQSPYLYATCVCHGLMLKTRKKWRHYLVWVFSLIHVNCIDFPVWNKISS